MSVTRFLLGIMLGLAVAPAIAWCAGDVLPLTAGDTLSGRHVVLADAVRGHATVLVAGFSREAGDRCGEWVKAIHADGELASVNVYEIAMLEGAPSLLRGMIKSGMKKGVPAAEHDRFVVFTQDEKLWRDYFDVKDTQIPYVVLIDASGTVLWRGHGLAADTEQQLRGAMR